MAENIDFQSRAAVEALSRWVTFAPIPHSSKEWRERCLRLDAEVRRLSMKLDRDCDERLNGAAKSRI